MSNTNNTTTTWASHTFVKDHKFQDENDSNYASSTNTHTRTHKRIWEIIHRRPIKNYENKKQCEKEETHNVTGHFFSSGGENLFTSFRDRQKRQQQQFIIIIIVIIIIVIHFHYTIKRTNTHTHTHACGYGWNVKKKTFIYVHSLFTSHKNE